MKTLFVSDLHLKPERADLAMAYLQFLQSNAPQADALYVLGDLFEYWIGDDAADMIGARPVLEAMKATSQVLPCYFIAGNRDFLVGERFEQESGFQIVPDETVVDLYGTPTLLLHGDSMCTDDIAHMAFRAEVVTNDERKQQFLSLPIPLRVEQAQAARMESGKHKSEISMDIMDVSSQSVLETFERFEVKQMIHGHTHRQHIHDHGEGRCRYVLGDWDQTGSVLTATPDGLVIDNFPINPS